MSLTNESVGIRRLTQAIFPQLLAERGPVDAEHLGGGGAVVLALFQDGLEDRGLDQLE